MKLGKTVFIAKSADGVGKVKREKNATFSKEMSHF